MSKIVACVGIRLAEDFSFSMFKHWVRHYVGYGFKPDDWRLTLFTDNGDNSDLVVDWLNARGICVQNVFLNSPQHDPHAQEAEYLTMRATLEPDDWIVILDADEFIDYPDSVGQFFEDMDRMGHNAVRGYLVDRVAANFTLPAVNNTNIFDQFPLKTSISRHICHAVVQKMCGFKNCFETPLGHHWLKQNMAINRWPGQLQVHHFKWTKGLRNRLLRTVAMPVEKIFWKHEIRSLLPYVEEDRLNLSSEQVQLVPSA